MPRDPDESEAAALAKAGVLLSFAAENKELPQATVATICASLDAVQSRTWDQNIATNFWLAFNSLCVLIRPVTLDTLSTNQQTVPTSRWWFRRADELISPSRRTANNYLILMGSLLVAAVICSFVVSTANSFSADIKKLFETGNQLTVKIVADADVLETTVGTKKFSEAGTETQKFIAGLQNQLQEQSYILDQMLQKTELMSRVMSFGTTSTSYKPGTWSQVSTIEEVRSAVSNYFDVRRKVTTYLLKQGVYVGIMTSSLLPVILGLMGACAYVVRLVSEQIKDTTFSTTSPIRHRVRVALGGLAGVVIGLGGIVDAGSLSPSALAFIAGYAVEPVFSTFDSIAEKFRR